MDESSLINRCQTGDTNSFGELYETYNQKIYSYIYYRTHHQQTAEDITSIVFIKALNKISLYSESKGSFSSWLYRIAHNAVIDHYRTSRPTQDIDTVWDLQEDTDIERDIEVSNKIKEVREILKDLTKEQRDIVIMRIWDGMSFTEISTVLDKSEDSTKMMFYRTIKKIRTSSSLAIVVLSLFRI